MEANGRQKRLVVHLEILEARNVVVKPAESGDTLFVRYYFSTGSGKGNSNISGNTREVMATSDPQWKQNFSLECRVTVEDVNGNICELQEPFVRLELTERSNKIRVLGSMFRESKLLGWVEIPWKNILASPTLSINTWFSLVPATGGESAQLQPTLHVAVCALQFLGASVSQLPQRHPTEMDPQVMSYRTEIRRNYVNVNRRINRLERDGCRCGGKLCCQCQNEEAMFADVA